MTPHEIRELRQSLGMTQADLADYLRLRSKSHVSHLERGRIPAVGPTLRLLELLRTTEGRILSTVQMLEKKTEKS